MTKKIKSYGKAADTAMRSWIETSRAFTAIRAKESAYIESYDLTIHQFGVLEAVYHLGSLTIGEITKLALSTPGNMTVVIKNLKSKDLIETKQDKNDKRKTFIALTAKGEKLISDIFPQHAKNMTGYFEALSHDEQVTLQKLMRKLTASNKEPKSTV